MIDWRDILSLWSRHPTKLHEEHRLLYLSPGPKIKTPAYYLLEGTAKAAVMSFNEMNLGPKLEKSGYSIEVEDG